MLRLDPCSTADSFHVGCTNACQVQSHYLRLNGDGNLVSFPLVKQEGLVSYVQYSSGICALARSLSSSHALTVVFDESRSLDLL